jgi:hypothetical protein
MHIHSSRDQNTTEWALCTPLLSGFIVKSRPVKAPGASATGVYLPVVSTTLNRALPLNIRS